LWTLAAAAGAILVNLGLGTSLIHGYLGLPALGLAGAGIASAFAGTTLFIGLSLVVTLDPRFRRYRLFDRVWRADWPRFFELMRLGLPIAIALAFEATIFSAATLMMGLIGAAAVAAHAIAMQIGTLGYMVPTGIAQAATVRVGLARGAGDAEWIRRAGWTAYAMALGASGLVALFVVLEPRFLASLFIDVDAPANAEVVVLALTYLGFAALFLMTDSLQVVIAGMLRGLFDACADVDRRLWVLDPRPAARRAPRLPFRLRGHGTLDRHRLEPRRGRPCHDGALGAPRKIWPRSEAGRNVTRQLRAPPTSRASTLLRSVVATAMRSASETIGTASEGRPG
jgi:hypothetical protein